jgi:Leucine-rich repeat (LRR) protein
VAKKVTVAGKQVAISATKLELKGVELRSTEALRPLEQLEHLVIRDSKMADLSGICALPRLKELLLKGTGLERLDGIEGLTTLEELRVHDNPVRAIPDLRALEKLRYLAVDCSLTSIDAAKLPTCLGSLGIGGPLSRIEHVERLQNLTQLFLRGTQIATLAWLAALPRLFKLKCEKSPIIELDASSFPPELLMLFATDCRVANLQTRGGHAVLRDLSLVGNSLVRLEGIEEFGALQELAIADCPIRSMSPATFAFIQRKQAVEDPPFFLWVTRTTPRKKVEDVVKKQKIEIV